MGILQVRTVNNNIYIFFVVYIIFYRHNTWGITCLYKHNTKGSLLKRITIVSNIYNINNDLIVIFIHNLTNFWRKRYIYIYMCNKIYIWKRLYKIVILIYFLRYNFDSFFIIAFNTIFNILVYNDIYNYIRIFLSTHF